MTRAATPRRAAFRPFPVHVARTRWLTPAMVRITFAGSALSGLVSGGRDQRAKVLLPRPGQAEPLMPCRAGSLGWYETWRRMPEETRPVLRTYTIRAQRTEPQEIDIDFAIHGDLGPASRWAATALPGNRVLVVGPTAPDAGGIDFDPPADTRRVLLAGDETALPAIASILRTLPRGLTARVYAEVENAEQRVSLRDDAEQWVSLRDHAEQWAPLPDDAEQRESGPGAVEVGWLYRDGGPSRIPAALREAELPAEGLYVWLAGETSVVRDLRRHLIRDRGLDRRAVCCRGYWRAGLTEDDLDTPADTSADTDD